jgi:ribonuclease-3
MTMRLNTRASNSYLATVGGAVGLARYVRINPAQQGDISPSTMATTVEALIGAVYPDSEPGLSAVKAVMIRLGIMDAEE